MGALEFTASKVDWLSKNSLTLGLSCTPPLCLCSSGSWHNRWLWKTVTQGTVKMYSTMPRNDNATKSWKRKLLKACKYANYRWNTYWSFCLSPSRVSLLRSIIAFWLPVKSPLAFTSSSTGQGTCNQENHPSATVTREVEISNYIFSTMLIGHLITYITYWKSYTYIYIYT